MRVNYKEVGKRIQMLQTESFLSKEKSFEADKKEYDALIMEYDKEIVRLENQLQKTEEELKNLRILVEKKEELLSLQSVA